MWWGGEGAMSVVFSLHEALAFFCLVGGWTSYLDLK